jgi:hypothetical protein
MKPSPLASCFAPQNLVRVNPNRVASKLKLHQAWRRDRHVAQRVVRFPEKRALILTSALLMNLSGDPRVYLIEKGGAGGMDLNEAERS